MNNQNENQNQADQSISEYYYLSSTNSSSSSSSYLAKLEKLATSSSSSKKIRKHQAYKKDGSITEYGLATGQIQVCPSYPKNHIYLCRESGIITVTGWDAKENKVFKTFSKLPTAISYLSRF